MGLNGIYNAIPSIPTMYLAKVVPQVGIATL
jgi:hypothetical protein